MESFDRFDLERQEAGRKLARYRLEAAQARLLPHTTLRSRVARGLYRLAERLEPAPPAPHAPEPTL